MTDGPIARHFVPPQPANEAERLAALHEHQILDTAPDPRFDLFTDLAAALLQTPIASISLVDADRQWFKAVRGLGSLRQTPRDIAFCAHAICQPQDVMVVEDATQDPRFADNPLVTGATGLRFYAGAPILDANGHPIGVLCGMDTVARPRPDAAALRTLRQLARGVAGALQLHRTERSMQQQAMQDELTGLATRGALLQRLHGMAQNGAQRAALLVVGLDRLKLVNYGHGLAVGDELLREAARRLVQGRQVTDLVARLSGDEFAVLLSDPLSPGHVMATAQAVQAALQMPFMVRGLELNCSAGIGVALYPEDAAGAEELLRAADAALVTAKSIHRRRVHRFDANADRQQINSAVTEHALRQALSQGGAGLYLAWQPIVNLATGRVAAREALLRWNRPGFGPVSPGEFIPVAELCGLGPALDEWVLRTACREAAAWPDGDVLASVNITRATLRSLPGPRLAAMIEAALLQAGLPPHRLELEVPESCLVEDAAAAGAAVAGLRSRGMQVVLDDFGEGSTSLRHLHDIEFDRIKLDRSLMTHLASSRRDRALVGGVVRMAQELGIAVTAEGVETGAQLEVLRQLGCDYAQGYLLGQPAPQSMVAMPVRLGQHSG